MKTRVGINFAVNGGEAPLKNLFYFELTEAEKLRDTYTSWIGKEAHVGKGMKEKLRKIQIKARRTKARKPQTLYHVQFVFDNKTFSAYEFLYHNSLQTTSHPLINPERQIKLPL